MIFVYSLASKKNRSNYNQHCHTNRNRGLYARVPKAEHKSLLHVVGDYY